MPDLGRGFDAVADAYDDARPDYPDEVYDEVERVTGRLGGRDVLDLAAGTGIATRELVRRGARVVAVEPGEPMLRRLRAASPGVPAVLGTGEALPVRAASFDLVTCVTAWHWLSAGAAVAEVARVLRPGGHLALWWANNRWGDGVEWELAQSAVYDRWQTQRGSRGPTEDKVGAWAAGEDLRRRGVEVAHSSVIAWTRQRTREQHVAAIATHSDVIALGDRTSEFLVEVTAALAPWPVVTERLWGPLVIARFG